MCQKHRLREQEERDIIKHTVLLLSLCPRLHVPTDSPVYFLPSDSFGVSPAGRHWEETELSRKSLLHRQSLPHFLSSTLSFPGCLLCAACQPVARVASYWKEAQKYFDLKLSWQHQWLDQKDSGGGMRRPNGASPRLLCWHDESRPRRFPLLWAQTFILCWLLNHGHQRDLIFQVWIHVQDCCCYCHDIIWVWLDKLFFKTLLPTCTGLSTSNRVY